MVDDFKLEIARPMCLFFILNKKSYRRVCDLTPISKKYYRAAFFLNILFIKLKSFGLLAKAFLSNIVSFSPALIKRIQPLQDQVGPADHLPHRQDVPGDKMAHQAAFKGLVGLQVISLQELPELVLFGNILLLLAPDQDYASHACNGF